MKGELPAVQAEFRKDIGTRDQITHICWIMEKARKFQKNNYFCFIDYVKAFDCVDHKKLENSSRDGDTRPSYLPPEKPVCKSRSSRRITRHGTMDWFQIEKGVLQGCICHPTYLTSVQRISWKNPGCFEVQSGIKIAKRNISHLRYADDITLMAESEEELKSLLRRMKEESEKADLKLNIK